MEHLQHFGLSQDPFSNEPDLRFYFESTAHRDAHRRVERGLRQHKGLTLLTGDGGMGKTLLARRILDALEEEVFEATLLVMLAGAADATGILQRFARQLGVGEPACDRAALLGEIYEQLAIVREDGRHAVLIVDDAQIMTSEVFSELSGLLNLEYEDRRLMSMLLVGSPELDELAQNDPTMMPRIDVRVRLQPLDMQNAQAYLAHRLAAVNGNPALLPTAAIEALYKLGRGRPRLLNTLADNALFEAYLAGRTALEPSDVERAASDLGIGPDPGSTYSERSLAAPVPAAPAAAAPSLSLAAEPLAQPPSPQTASLDMTEEIEELELVTPVEAAPELPGMATLDLDHAFDDFDETETEPPPTLMAERTQPDAMDTFEFNLESEVLSSESEPTAASFALDDEPADAIEVDFEPEIEPEIEPEPRFTLAEAELDPLDADEMEAFEDAFVELIEE